MDRSKRNTRKLGQLVAGEKLRLYAKHRDGTLRSPYRFGPLKTGLYLAGQTLTVLRHVGATTVVLAGKVEIPLCSQMRVMG